MGRLFGTDGIRGVANGDLTPDLAYRLGRATGHLLAAGSGTVVVGQDTRRSGDVLTAAVAAGLGSVGTSTVQLGVVTTPCVAFATASDGVAGGVMVSASHNPATDNGLKVLRGGRKLAPDTEDELERLMEQADDLPAPGNGGMGRIAQDTRAVERYEDHLRAAAGEAFIGLRLVIDCANGSASALAPALFRSLGADVGVCAAEPDGSNINLDCGSTHPEGLQAAVVASRARLGLAFDGDADRLIAVDERGNVVDGDTIMGICALERLAAGTLRNKTLVATVMSNGGLERAIRAAGGRLIRTAVGDWNVLEAMEREGCDLGGEQSGHIIFRDVSSTGDGLLTAIQLVATLRAAGDRPLSELAGQIPKLPQLMLNSAVRQAREWHLDGEMQAAVANAQARLAERGRILVRPSGTEAKLRIMVEGEDEMEIGEIARQLAALAEQRLN